MLSLHTKIKRGRPGKPPSGGGLLGDLVSLGDHLLDASDHVEGLLREVIVLAVQNALQGQTKETPPLELYFLLIVDKNIVI